MVFLKMRNEESHEPQSHGTLQDGATGLLVKSRGDNLIHSHATLLRFCCQWSKAYFFTTNGEDLVWVLLRDANQFMSLFEVK